jgi:hypothetical protein
MDFNHFVILIKSHKTTAIEDFMSEAKKIRNCGFYSSFKKKRFLLMK